MVEPLAIDLNILATFLTGAVTLALTQFFRFFYETRQKTGETKARAKVAAAQVTTDIDLFAYSCASVLSDNDLDEQSGGFSGTASYNLPPIPLFVEHPQFEKLLPEDQVSVLSLRLLRTKADNLIQFWENLGERDSVPSAANAQLARMGYRAYVIARKVRQNNGLEEPNYLLSDFDFVEILRKRSQKESKEE